MPMAGSPFLSGGIRARIGIERASGMSFPMSSPDPNLPHQGGREIDPLRVLLGGYRGTYALQEWVEPVIGTILVSCRVSSKVIS
jgi:hypothetical protein